jgi:signal transduction histidine kinase
MNANRFQQVLNNLLNNALRATKFGQITIIIKYKQQTNKLICEVQDSGEGISNQA